MDYVIDAGWRESAYDDLEDARRNAHDWIWPETGGPRDEEVEIYEQTLENGRVLFETLHADRELNTVHTVMQSTVTECMRRIKHLQAEGRMVDTLDVPGVKAGHCFIDDAQRKGYGSNTKTISNVLRGVSSLLRLLLVVYEEGEGAEVHVVVTVVPGTKDDTATPAL